jgi:hypothetical protein
MTLSHGFELQREERLKEIGATARQYRHAKTGAELLSFVGDDENKVFGVSFRTPPSDSTGIAHILEHSVLCGSKKYPVKAPFLEMLKSSLNSFLNAMTYPDKTIYPVASVNLQDFYNLVDVYLDAVFHPRITPEILKQEGWHYELESPDAPLIYKGVVFNEMKGVYSSPDNRVSELSQQSLYPDTTYGVDSGGDPNVIPNLTYDAFKSFHSRLYHPSNAKFVFYGDDDPERRLEILDKVLSAFEPIKVDSEVALQPRFNAPRRQEYTLPASDEDGKARQGRITLNWMLDEVTEPEVRLALGILDYVLLGTPAAPLRKALIDSRLGDNVIGGGLEAHLRQMSFATGLKGIDPKDDGKVEALVFDTLERLAREGIDPLTVEAAMNTTEFRLRENNTGAFPRGISIMMRALQTWNYDRDALGLIAWEKPMEALKARLASGERVFETLIRSHLLDNPHRTTLLFKPDPAQSEREAQEERARLDKVRAAMSEDEVRAVIADTQALKRMQETPDSPEALATIPVLRLKDLPTQNTLIPIETGKLAGADLVTHDLPANGVVYLDLGFDLRRLPAELLPYMGIFCRALLETGTAKRDFVALSQQIGRVTGGISAQRWTSAALGSNQAAARLFLRSKAMPEKVGELASILQEVLLTSRLDNAERIEQLINEERASMEARLVPMGSHFVTLRLRSSLNEAEWASEQMGGITYLRFLRELTIAMKERPGDVTAALEKIRGILVRSDAAVVNVTSDAKDLARVRPDLESLVASLPASGDARPDWPMPELPRFEGLTMPAKVNYVAKGESLPRLGYRPGGAALVANHWLDATWLWDKVRVQGGAYGAFSRVDTRAGLFSFASYRDPNLLQTVAAYDGSAAFLRGVADDDKERERAIIGMIGNIDAYMLPDAKGFVSLQRYLVGDSDERLQKIREEVLGASAADIRAFADALDAISVHGRVVVLGSEEAINKANAGLENRFTLTKVL